MTVPITVLYYPDDITLLHSLYPLLTTRYRRLFRFTKNLSETLRRRGRNLLVVRFHKRPEYGRSGDVFERLRSRYSRLVYFDDFADPREVNAAVFPFVDAYFKKQLLRDTTGYLRPVYGKTLFAEYYHQHFGIDDHPEMIAPALNQAAVAKLRLSWNMGLGSYPRSRWVKRFVRLVEPFAGPPGLRPFFRTPLRVRSSDNKVPRVSARLGINFDRNTLVFHRRLYQKVLEERPDLYLTGRVSLEQYNRELRQVRATFSPFGFGEVCFRDFEAIVNRSVLIKPRMDHVLTWPDVYVSDKTYVPVSWDGSDLVDRTESTLGNLAASKRLAANALEALHDGYRNLDSRVQTFLSEFDL